MEELIKLLDGLLTAGKAGDEAKSLELLGKLESYKDLIGKLGKATGGSDITLVDNYDELSEKLDATQDMFDSNPMYRKEKFVDDATKALSGAFDLFVNLNEARVVGDQIREYKRQAGQLQKPAPPVTPPVSPGVEENVELTRRALGQPNTAFTAARERNTALLDKALVQAKTAATGNAGAYGSLAQNAINSARMQNNQLAGQEQLVMDRKQQNFQNALRLEEIGKMNRFGTEVNRFNTSMTYYNDLAKSVGLLGAQAGANQVQNVRNFGSTIPGLSRLGADIGVGVAQGGNPFTSNIGVNPVDNEAIGEINQYNQSIQPGLVDGYSRNQMLVNALGGLNQLNSIYDTNTQ